MGYHQARGKVEKGKAQGMPMDRQREGCFGQEERHRKVRAWTKPRVVDFEMPTAGGGGRSGRPGQKWKDGGADRRKG